MAIEIRAPIFILGAPRSGTSVLYKKLARHPDLAWISNITKKVPRSLLVTRAIMLFRDDHRPTEAKKIWKKFSRSPDASRPLEEATPRVRRFLRRVVRNNLKLFGKSRFLSKDPGNSLRMEFLDAIFPDALFVHIIRDGRAVAYSALRNRRKRGAFYGIKIPGWRDLVDRPMVEACGLQWERTVEAVIDSSKRFPPERYMEIRYEDFTQAPEETLEVIGEKCGLAWDPTFLKELVSDVQSQNFKWREGLSAAEIETLNDLIGESLARFGYAV